MNVSYIPTVHSSNMWERSTGRGWVYSAYDLFRVINVRVYGLGSGHRKETQDKDGHIIINGRINENQNGETRTNSDLNTHERILDAAGV